jgi:hypothetical protein
MAIVQISTSKSHKGVLLISAVAAISSAPAEQVWIQHLPLRVLQVLRFQCASGFPLFDIQQFLDLQKGTDVERVRFRPVTVHAVCAPGSTGVKVEWETMREHRFIYLSIGLDAE